MPYCCIQVYMAPQGARIALLNKYSCVRRIHECIYVYDCIHTLQLYTYIRTCLYTYVYQLYKYIFIYHIYIRILHTSIYVIHKCAPMSQRTFVHEIYSCNWKYVHIYHIQMYMADVNNCISHRTKLQHLRMLITTYTASQTKWC